MNNTTLQIKFKQRLNKLASEDFDNIQCWEIVEAFNKAQLEWSRRQLRGSNLFKDGDEASKRRVDDLQILLKTMGLEGEDVAYNDEFGYFKATNFSGIYDDDYLEFKRIETQATQVLPGPCGEPATPPTPAIPEIPEITETVVITEAVEEVPAASVNVPEILNTHLNETCCIGFSGAKWSQCLSEWTSGMFTWEDMIKRCPVTNCCWQRIYNCDGGPPTPTVGPDFDDPDFCQCVTDNAQNGTPDTAVDCENYLEESINIAQWDWADPLIDYPQDVNGNYVLCEENTDDYTVCQEATNVWMCEEGQWAGLQLDYQCPPGTDTCDWICVQAVAEETAEVVTQEFVPGVPATGGTEATEDGPPILHPQADENCCRKSRSLTAYLSEVANVDVILRDPLKNPNFDWGETIVTMQDNEVRVWRKDFFILDPKLIYYRKPMNIQIKGCVDPYTNKESTMEIECEFKDDIVELIIDEAVSIVAGDIMDVNQFSRGSQQAEKNN